MIRYSLFDLDDTLYAPSTGLMPAIGDRMRSFLESRYNLAPAAAHELQKRYYDRYGTTLRGLMLEQEIDPQDYLLYVHDVDVAQYIRPDPKLRRVLEGLPFERVIVTNGDLAHAQRVLRQLGVADLFTHIFDIVFMEYECKPARGAYERVLHALGAQGDECLLIEDTLRNLSAARELGMRTILVAHPLLPAPSGNGLQDPAAAVHSNGNCPPEADLCIPDIYQVAQAAALLAGVPSDTPDPSA